MDIWEAHTFSTSGECGASEDDSSQETDRSFLQTAETTKQPDVRQYTSIKSSPEEARKHLIGTFCTLNTSVENKAMETLSISYVIHISQTLAELPADTVSLCQGQH